jgi:single-strand DNA-binding protein
MNHVAITGNLTRAPEMIESAKVPLTKFRIGVNGSKPDGNGGYTEDRNFFDVVCFNGVASNVSKYLDKGSRVAVSGRLNWSEWQDKDGNTRQSVEIVGNSVELLDSKPTA